MVQSSVCSPTPVQQTLLHCRPLSQCVRVTTPAPSMLCHTRTQLGTPACQQARAVIRPTNVCKLQTFVSQPRLSNVAAVGSTDLSSSTAALAASRTNRARRAAAVCQATVGKAEPGSTTLGFCGMGIMGVPMVGAAAAPAAAVLSSPSNPHSLQPNSSSRQSSAPYQSDINSQQIQQLHQIDVTHIVCKTCLASSNGLMSPSQARDAHRLIV
jgi:hypothetical protein